jgi:hypothetical protein
MIYDALGMLPERAFQRDARGHILPQSGGGGSGPSSQTITQTNIPEYARPYAEEMLGQGQILTDTTANPYQGYGGQRFAGFSPMQAQAFQNVAGQQTAPQLTDASNLAYSGAQQGLGAQQNAMGLQGAAAGYGQAGAGYGGAASTLGLAGAQQAMMDANRAQRGAQMYGGMGAGFGSQGAMTAAQSQRAAEGQADMYGQMGAGFGAVGAGIAPQAQQYGATAADIGMTGMGYGAQGAGIGGIGVQQAQQGFGAGQQYAQQATSPESMQSYMSPYMQNVVDQQQREAVRQSQIQQQTTQSQAAQQGAFGGSRSSILEAERQRNLGTQLGDIQGAGLQNAFQQAQQAQQFGAGLGIQGLQAGYQGLQAGMAGTAQGMQGAQTGIQGQQAGLQGLGEARQLYGLGMQGAGLGLQGTGQRLAAGQLGLQGTAQGIQGAQAGLQGVGQQISGAGLGLEGTRTGIAGQQAGMQGAQTGLEGVGRATAAGQYGLSGAELGVRGAGVLGGLGGQQFEQEMAATDAMQKYGSLQQGQQQQALDFAYQQEIARQQYPYQQLSYMSDLLRGVPSTQSSQLQYARQPDQTAQLLGAGLSAYGAFGRKEGGQIKSYQQGGAVSPDAMSEMPFQTLPPKLRRLSDTQLAAYARGVKDAITLSAVQNEVQRRAKMRGPGAQMPADTTAAEVAKRAEAASLGRPRVSMAGGGIVALAPGGSPGTAEQLANQFNQYLNKMGGAYAGDTPPPPPSPIAPPPPPPAPLPAGSIANPEIADQAGSMLPNRGQPPAPSPVNQKPGGIMQASQVATPSVSAFDQFKASIPRGEMEPAQQTLLKDMQARLEEKMGRAEGQENTSIYDALLTAGLAMMGGTSLADGIARAAQTGGATFLAGKKDAQKAVETAENAEIAFRQYEMEVMKGNDKAAADLFDKFNKNIIDLKQIDASYARTAAMGSDTNITRLLSQSRLLEEQINKNNTAVRNNAKYKGKLDAFNKQMEQFPLSASDQAKYNTLLSDIAADAADRNKSVQQQLDNVNSRITGSSGGSGDSGGSGGFTYRGTVESKE